MIRTIRQVCVCLEVNIGVNNRWYTEMPDYCDAIRAGRFAPRVFPEAAFGVETCYHMYEETMEKNYVLALPETTKRQHRFLNQWMKSHDGKTPFDPLASNKGGSVGEQPTGKFYLPLLYRELTAPPIL